MTVFGLTGGSGGGKSFVASVWCGLGAKVLDCDALYHQMLRENTQLQQDLANRFPESLQTDGGIDRGVLRSLVFTNAEALRDLNKITHHYVVREAMAQLQMWREEKVKAAVVEAIYLWEAGLGELCDVTVAVLASREERLRRLAVRDDLPKSQLQARLDAQQPDTFYEARCGQILRNDGSQDTLRRQAAALYIQLSR